MRQWKQRILSDEIHSGKKNIMERRAFNAALRGGSDSIIRRWLRYTDENRPKALSKLVAREVVYMDDSGVGAVYPKPGKSRYKVTTTTGSVWWVKWLDQYQFDYYHDIEERVDEDVWKQIHAPYHLWTLNPRDESTSIHLLCMPSYGKHVTELGEKEAARKFAGGEMKRLHERKVYHGDLFGENRVNWGNILVNEENEFRLIDFGVQNATSLGEVDVVSIIKTEKANMEQLMKKPLTVEKPKGHAKGTGNATKIFGHSTKRAIVW